MTLQSVGAVELGEMIESRRPVLNSIWGTESRMTAEAMKVSSSHGSGALIARLTESLRQLEEKREIFFESMDLQLKTWLERSSAVANSRVAKVQDEGQQLEVEIKIMEGLIASHEKAIAYNEEFFAKPQAASIGERLEPSHREIERSQMKDILDAYMVSETIRIPSLLDIFGAVDQVRRQNDLLEQQFRLAEKVNSKKAKVAVVEKEQIRALKSTYAKLVTTPFPQTNIEELVAANEVAAIEEETRRTHYWAQQVDLYYQNKSNASLQKKVALQMELEKLEKAAAAESATRLAAEAASVTSQTGTPSSASDKESQVPATTTTQSKTVNQRKRRFLSVFCF